MTIFRAASLRGSNAATSTRYRSNSFLVTGSFSMQPPIVSNAGDRLRRFPAVTPPRAPHRLPRIGIHPSDWSRVNGYGPPPSRCHIVRCNYHRIFATLGDEILHRLTAESISSATHRPLTAQAASGPTNRQKRPTGRRELEAMQYFYDDFDIID